VEENGTPDISYQEPESGHDQIPELAARFEEQRKMMSSFDPKKSESIVFAPYHMIDYFASQGIKLVIEENPIDPFAKQLKSFTDWLKVMKKLPAKAILEKTDEKDEDRVRHYAAHSIDEREILTESMAEVLAKQGMYENAIALYQKLSLIYPPKSAYFASRIEQLKASLP
jgi:tetratricopeptide (TPR) repeat protein